MPVGEGVERAGSPRPSALDCSVPQVVDRAAVLDIATGIDVDEYVMDRDFLLASMGYGSPRALRTPRLATQVSPPLAIGGRGPVVERGVEVPSNISIIDLTWNEEEGRSRKKRKRFDASAVIEEQDDENKTTVSLSKKLIHLMNKVEEEARKLSKLVGQNPNTKREIKEVSAAIRSIASQITTNEMVRLVRGSGGAPSVEEAVQVTQESACQTELAGAVGTKDTGTQTEESRVLEPTDGKVEKLCIRKAREYADYMRLKNLSWPEDVYTTRRVDGSVEENTESDILVWNEQPTNSGQTAELFRRFEDIRKAKGDRAVVFLTAKTMDFEGRETVRDQTLLKLSVDGTERDCFEKLKQTREFLRRRGRVKVALYPPGGSHRGYIFRKMVECAFGGSDIECTVYYRGTTGKDTKAPAAEAARRARATDAVIVGREEGKTYADLLRMVKKKIEEDKTGLQSQIRNIRGSKDGDLVITTRAGGEGMVNLKKWLTKAGDLNVRASRADSRRVATMFIKGMDAVATKEEVREAVRKETGELPARVGELRPYYGSCQAVTLSVNRGAARILIAKRAIRVGLNICGVTEKIELTQCYRCWGYGHVASACGAATDRSSDCRNCGAGGHSKADCEGGKRCPLCEKDGHRAGEGTCHALRRALREARRKRQSELAKEEEEKEGETSRRQSADESAAAEAADVGKEGGGNVESDEGMEAERDERAMASSTPCQPTTRT